MKKDKKEEVIEEKVSEAESNEEVIEEKIELTKEEIMVMNQKISDAEEKALRASAELVNYRKRKDEEVVRMLKYANEDLILELLPIIDNFERGLKVEGDSKVLDGMKMIYSSLINTLEKYGVKEIDALDKEFDENYHHAVMKEENKDKKENIILEVFQKGYTYKEKVIRPAMVKVNK